MSNLERLVPDRRVSLDGEVLAPDLAGRISRISVDLSDGVFNECRIVFTDPDMALISGKKLSAGAGVFVELGFQGKLKPVFEGEIVSIEPRFVRDHPPSIVVRALERLHRLALAPQTRSFNDVDAAEVVKIIAKENGLSGEAPAGSKGHLLQANVTDFQLLRKIAARTGNRIWLSGKKLVLGPPPSLGEIECIPGEGLKRLKVKLRTTEQVPKVVVRGWDPKDKKEIVGQAQPQGEAGDGAKDAKPFGRTELFIEGPLVRDTAEAEKIAKAAMGFIAERYAVAEGEILGHVGVLPGIVLNFDKLGELLDGKYRVTSARHEFDKRGYRVAFSATRIAKKKSALKFKAPAAAAPPAEAKKKPKNDPPPAKEEAPPPEAEQEQPAAATEDAPAAEEPAKEEEAAGEDEHWVVVALSALGDAPHAEELVILRDPDTLEQVGEPVKTDASGTIRVKVPEEKTYLVEFEDDEHEPAPPAMTHGPEETSHLACHFADEKGAPLANEKVRVTGDGETHELETDADGDLFADLAPGPYEVEVRGRKFAAHTIDPDDYEEGRRYYEFKLGATAAA